jgi:diadenosine tetraphosphate (Ap4A) HIT family hydrolase
MVSRCVFCREEGGDLLWRDEMVQVVAADEPDYPGFCRVVWHAHVAEFSDLDCGEREHLMRVVCAVESAVRAVMSPNKVNLASLGNQVPHLHWHVIPRYTDDRHFPAPVWAEATRAADPIALAERRAQAGRLKMAIRTQLQLVRS